MSWAISINGSNQRLLLPSTTSLTDFRITVENLKQVASTASGQFQAVIGDLASFNNFVSTTSSGWHIRISGSNYTIPFSSVKEPITGGDLVLERLGNQLTISFDGDEFTRSVTSSAFSLGCFGVINAASPSSNHSFGGGIGNITLTDGVNVIGLWDLEASDRSNTGLQPVIVNTVGGNDAVGVNIPTDGSQWVNLGGEVVESVDVELTALNIQSTSEFTAHNINISKQVDAIDITSSTKFTVINADTTTILSPVNITSVVNFTLSDVETSTVLDGLNISTSSFMGSGLLDVVNQNELSTIDISNIVEFTLSNLNTSIALEALDILNSLDVYSISLVSNSVQVINPALMNTYDLASIAFVSLNRVITIPSLSHENITPIVYFSMPTIIIGKYEIDFNSIKLISTTPKYILKR